MKQHRTIEQQKVIKDYELAICLYKSQGRIWKMNYYTELLNQYIKNNNL